MEENEQLQRHPTLYKATGDLVISAAHENVTHLFRVHTVILAEHSPVFAGMLTLPMAANGVETYDGVPSVHLPDNVKDVTALLEVLYTPGSPLFKRADPAFAADVYGLMSIATKYEVDSICKAIVHHLKAEWPKTLEELVQLKREVRHAYFGEKAVPFPGPERALPEPASAIRLATDFDIPEILPAAYYLLSVLDISSWSYSDKRARWDLLRHDELLRYYQGKHRLSQELIHEEGLFPIDYVDGCSTLVKDFDWDDPDCDFWESSKCRKRIESVRGKREYRFRETRDAHRFFAKADPIDELMRFHAECQKWNLCHWCTNVIQDHCRQQMKRIWDDRIPKGFSLSEEHPIIHPEHPDKDPNRAMLLKMMAAFGGQNVVQA